MTQIWSISLIVFVLLVVILILKKFFWYGRLKQLTNKHVVITGGSSGIGKCAAIYAARQGAHVTIIARDLKKLEAAKNEILHACQNKEKQKVECVSLDIGNNYGDVEKTFNNLERTIGPIYMLINCAGIAICGKVEDTTIDNLKYMVNLNFMGTYYAIKAVISSMKSAHEGIIVITSSQAALLGIFGYSAYGSTKFALRGLAESVAMEVAPYNISVTLSLPPDTDTPGFALEDQSKPLETKLISEGTGPVSPESVAEQLMKDALTGRFFSTVGLEGFILTSLCAGMSPISSITELLLQALLAGMLRLVGACYLISFRRIILNCMKNRDKNKKSE
ncbi:3-ketodihydrosphingosine reductase [Athalia rosae]|uniref:3-ketodihydrosphingosine reductase n=1 Tax=Athalia rosae TaxID=37344 RepID=UPI0006265964|nr:3-ketodihydrosphingosine reductase [Athalia rosae]XP_048516277.1 3-ketodihydrosphingosine reductase [Athalia rosae]XP_048516278.1 3-ketodihydrosphingosine reductase [Athalia rosae]